MPLLNDIFNDSLLISFDDNMNPVFLLDNIIYCNKEPMETFGEDFLAFFSLKSSSNFLLLKMDEQNIYFFIMIIVLRSIKRKFLLYQI